jgi:hypothetical protein
MHSLLPSLASQFPARSHPQNDIPHLSHLLPALVDVSGQSQANTVGLIANNNTLSNIDVDQHQVC